MYDPSMIDNRNYVFDASSINMDTAMGMCNVH